MEGQATRRPATVDVVSELDGGATPRSRPLRDSELRSSSLATAGRGGAERSGGERQGGNGRGDAVRLLARIPSRGVKCAAGRFGIRSDSSGSSRELRKSLPKRSEPQDRQRDATSPRPPSGGNRRGGAKPRGRNGIGGDGSPSTEAHGNVGGSGRSVAVTHAVSAARGRWRGEGRSFRGCGESRGARDRRRTNPTRGGRESDQGNRQCSEGEPRPRGSARSSAARRVYGAAPSEHLEDPRGNA